MLGQHQGVHKSDSEFSLEEQDMKQVQILQNAHQPKPPPESEKVDFWDDLRPIKQEGGVVLRMGKEQIKDIQASVEDQVHMLGEQY